MQDNIQIMTATALEAQNRSEVDVQIATAKRYPRNINNSLNMIRSLAAHDAQTAQECFYCLPRANDKIEGLSVRMAEIVATAWGNLRVATRIIGNDGKIITAQAVCIDLENNYAVSKEVQRKITDRNGKTFSEDMQVVTGNAASAIAFRNAVLAVVPKAMTKQIIDEVKAVAINQTADISTTRERAIAYYTGKGISEKDLLEWIGITNREELTQDKLIELSGLATAINEGTTTVEESIITPLREARAAKEAAKKGGKNASKVLESMKNSTNA